MASDSFAGTAATALATHDASWKAGPTNDGVTGAELDGSGALRVQSFKFCDCYYDDGVTGANSISHGSFLAGTVISGNIINGVGCRTNATQLGYQAALKSSTNVNTNFDQINVTRNNAFVSTITLGAAINLNTTQVELKIKIANTVDIVVTVNGTDYTLAGSGGNDASGSAVLTGGFPSVFIHRNLTGLGPGIISDWTDDAVAAVYTAGVPGQIQQRITTGFAA